MIPVFPRQIATRAVIIYIISLVAVSSIAYHYVMPLGYIALGIGFISIFFLFGSDRIKEWYRVKPSDYISNVFELALLLRLAWVIGSYFFYIKTLGRPFDAAAMDAMGYHSEAQWLSSQSWHSAFDYLLGGDAISDSGFSLFLTTLYKVFGPVIIIPRIINAFLGAWTCVLIYKLASRSAGESVGRMAAVMCALMPNLIIYCGYHLKEILMIFLETAFLERMDYLLRTRKYSFLSILTPTLLAGSLFLFRTVLGVVALFSFATAVMVSNTPNMKRGGKRVVIILWGVLCLAVAGGGTIATEIEGYWEERDTNLNDKRQDQTNKGNQWAKYATGSVMAPMVLVLPFSTMVNIDEGQSNQLTKHAGNFIRNFMGFFAFIAVLEALRKKKWRDLALTGAFTVAYLGIISLSAYGNSERFLLPGLPGLIIMWAYGLSELRQQTYRFFGPWCVVVVIMELAWAYFKLGSRGLF